MKFSLRDLFWLTLTSALVIALSICAFRNYQLERRVKILDDEYRRSVEEFRAFERYVGKSIQFGRDSKGQLFVNVID
jgi:hypothetical protein